MRTTGIDDALLGSTGADVRIFGLLAIAEDQQAAVRAAIEGLGLERAALAKDRVTSGSDGRKDPKAFRRTGQGRPANGAVHAQGLVQGGLAGGQCSRCGSGARKQLMP